MNNKKNILIFIMVAFFSALAFSCNKTPSHTDVIGPEDNQNYFKFTKEEMVVEVDSTITKFRIVGEWTIERTPYSFVHIDTVNTTAKHNVHFFNEVDIENLTLGEFHHLEGNKTYKDVKIFPKKITEKVVIYYDIHSWGQIENQRLKVTLQPKKKR